VIAAALALALLTATAARAAVAAAGHRAARRRVGSRRRPPRLPPAAVDFADRLLRHRRDRQVDEALPDALDAIARSLRSGGSLRQAVEEAAGATRGPLAADLTRVVTEIGAGAPLAASLERWAASRPLPGVRLATAALGLGAETGGASAQAIDGVAATLRTNLGISGEVRALSSQARLSALVIVLAPVAFALLAATADGATLSFLLGTPLGLACLGGGLGLDALGWWWMRRVIAVVT